MSAVTQKIEPKEQYTIGEVDSLPLEILEDLATNLRWVDRKATSSRWGGTRKASMMKQYKTRGFPRQFGNNQNITSREEFLRMRIKAAYHSSSYWDSKSAAEQKILTSSAVKKAKEEKEAKLPKVQVSVHTSIRIILKDKRPKGMKFILKKDGDTLTVNRASDCKGTVGDRICTEKAHFNAKAFLAAIRATTNINGATGLNISLTDTRGIHTIYFRQGSDNTEVKIAQYVRDSSYWLFNTSDLEKVVKEASKKYKIKYEVVEEK